MARVNLYAAAKASFGAQTAQIQANTLGELIRKLGQIPSCTYLLNGVNCQELNTPIRDTDEVDVLPVFAGG